MFHSWAATVRIEQKMQTDTSSSLVLAKLRMARGMMARRLLALACVLLATARVPYALGEESLKEDGAVDLQAAAEAVEDGADEVVDAAASAAVGGTEASAKFPKYHR